jgi:hypothetical protein
VARLRRSIDLESQLDYLIHTAGFEPQRQLDQLDASADRNASSVLAVLHETSRLCREAHWNYKRGRTIRTEELGAFPMMSA